MTFSDFFWIFPCGTRKKGEITNEANPRAAAPWLCRRESQGLPSEFAGRSRKRKHTTAGRSGTPAPTEIGKLFAANVPLRIFQIDMKTIPKGYHKCQLSIVNCQFKNAPFLHFYFLHKIKTLPVAAAYLSARGSDGPLERDRKNHYQTALSTLLERRHLVQAYTWQGVPLTTALTRLTLGFQARLERLWEWETLIPKVTPLPQKSHFAIHCTSHPDNYFFCA